MSTRRIDLATVTCLDAPQLRHLLQQKSKYMKENDAGHFDVEKSASFGLLQNVEAHMSHLIDHGATSAAELRLGEVKLALLDSDELGSLTPFEQVQIATLMPGSADEALALVKSLDRFSRADLHKLISEL